MSLRLGLCPAGERAGSARRAGHFHLLAQMKVTKAKGPTRSELSICLEDGAVDQDDLGIPTEASRQVSEPDRIEVLFFGDFLLDQQKKVTRLPGGTGALPRKAQACRQGAKTGSAQ